MNTSEYLDQLESHEIGQGYSDKDGFEAVVASTCFLLMMIIMTIGGLLRALNVNI